MNDYKDADAAAERLKHAFGTVSPDDLRLVLEAYGTLRAGKASEDRAAELWAATREGDGKPEGTRESLARCAKMLNTYAPECFPANEKGQVDFARAMMESAADEITAYLARAFPEHFTNERPPTAPGLYYWETPDHRGRPRPGLTHLEEGQMLTADELRHPAKWYGPIPGAGQLWPVPRPADEATNAMPEGVGVARLVHEDGA